MGASRERTCNRLVIKRQREEKFMKRMMVVTVAALLGIGASAIAAERHGASSMSPGHEMQNSKSRTKGASEYSPGDRMHDKGTVGMSRGTTKGASEYSPGDRMNDQRGK
jgi:hypothetical protein